MWSERGFITVFRSMNALFELTMKGASFHEMMPNVESEETVFTCDSSLLHSSELFTS